MSFQVIEEVRRKSDHCFPESMSYRVSKRDWLVLEEDILDVLVGMSRRGYGEG